LVMFSVKKSLKFSGMLHVKDFFKFFRLQPLYQNFLQFFSDRIISVKLHFFMKYMLHFFQYKRVEPSDNDISQINAC